jgi:hypothetical protein
MQNSNWRILVIYSIILVMAISIFMLGEDVARHNQESVDDCSKLCRINYWEFDKVDIQGDCWCSIRFNVKRVVNESTPH